MSDEITRKEFLKAGVATLVATSLGACSTDDSADDGAADESGTGGGACTGSVTANIATNHGHSLSVPSADINAGAASDYDLAGGTHVHMVSLSAGDMMMIAAGETVSVTSSDSGGHTHEVSLTC